DDATKTATVTYAAPSERMDRFNVAFEAYKKEAYEIRATTRHRDMMAGYNIVNIAWSHVEKQNRPLYLQPVAKDENYLWLEKDGNSTPRSTDGTGPLQQASDNGRSGRNKHKAKEGGASGMDMDAQSSMEQQLAAAVVTITSARPRRALQSTKTRMLRVWMEQRPAAAVMVAASARRCSRQRGRSQAR
ncbi:hypothetical protein BGZ47_003055, partial [Haplosporangium gracile]